MWQTNERVLNMVRDASTLIYGNVVAMLKRSSESDARSRAGTNDTLPPAATSAFASPQQQATHSFSVLPRSAGSSASTFEGGPGPGAGSGFGSAHQDAVGGGGYVASLQSCSGACVARERLTQNFYENAIEQLVRRAQLIDGRALHLSCELNALKTHVYNLQQQKQSLAVRELCLIISLRDAAALFRDRNTILLSVVYPQYLSPSHLTRANRYSLQSSPNQHHMYSYEVQYSI